MVRQTLDGKENLANGLGTIHQPRQRVTEAEMGLGVLRARGGWEENETRRREGRERVGASGDCKSQGRGGEGKRAGSKMMDAFWEGNEMRRREGKEKVGASGDCESQRRRGERKRVGSEMIGAFGDCENQRRGGEGKRVGWRRWAQTKRRELEFGVFFVLSLSKKRRG